ncbi:MAG: membrane protein insertase YidC [Clostridia bacterium]|nr:membrane protein insertase YidC [Clostridia bacterium]
MTALLNLIATPFGYVIKFLYGLTGSYVLSLIVFSFITKIVMLPFGIKQQKSVLETRRLQPKIEKIKKKYSNNPQKAQQEINDLYMKEGVNPMGGCGPLLIQMPIIMGIYQVARRPLSFINNISTATLVSIQKIMNLQGVPVDEKTIVNYELNIAHKLPEYVENLKSTGILDKDFEMIDFHLFGINALDLTQTPSLTSALVIIPLISAATSVLFSFINNKVNPQNGGAAQGLSMKITSYVMMPAMSFFMGLWFPAAVSIYWAFSNVASIFQTILLNKLMPAEKYMEKFEDKEEKRAEARRRNMERIEEEKKALMLEFEAEKKAANNKPQKESQEEE